MQDILERPHYRKLFFLVMALLLVIILVVRFFVLPAFDDKLAITPSSLTASLLDDVFTSIVVTVAIGGFVFWLTPQVMHKSKLESVEPHDIGDLLRSAANDTSEWWFRGGLGRYTRTTTLRLMDEAARRKNVRLQITIEILDPDNQELRASYATYRQGRNSALADASPWTETRVRHELLATILRAYKTKAQETMLDVKVVLSQFYSSFRLDVSSQYVVVTKEDKRAPALRCDKGTYFYNAYRDDVMLSASQGRHLGSKPAELDLSHLTPSVARQLFEHLLIKTDGVSDEGMASVIVMASDTKDPYA